MASYKLLINIQAGVIMTGIVSAPKDPLIQLPGLMPSVWPPRRLSDVVFLTHQNLCNNDLGCLRRLRWMFHTFVLNEETIDVVDKALTNRQDADPDNPINQNWPGQIFVPFKATFEIEDQAAVAMVGCEFLLFHSRALLLVECLCFLLFEILPLFLIILSLSFRILSLSF